MTITGNFGKKTFEVRQAKVDRTEAQLEIPLIAILLLPFWYQMRQEYRVLTSIREAAYFILSCAKLIF